jgi:hypothetical protein
MLSEFIINKNFHFLTRTLLTYAHQKDSDQEYWAMQLCKIIKLTLLEVLNILSKYKTIYLLVYNIKVDN